MGGHQGIEMNIPNQLLQVYIFFAKDGLIAILEKMTMTAMSPVETDCISGQKLPHQPGYGEHSGSEKKMRVISEQ